jgi:hypothetical protein
MGGANMSLATDLAAFELKLNKALRKTLETDLAESIRDEMSKSIERYTFTQSRGPNGGGVRDRRNFKEELLESSNFGAVSALGMDDTYILRVTDVAKFQSDAKIDKSLAEVVEEGDTRYRIYEARPFVAPTQMLMDNGLAEAVIADGLRGRGLVVL